MPTTQKRPSQVNTQTTKRKLSTSFKTTSNPVEKKRTKKTNLFHDVVSVPTTTMQQTKHSSPPPPWLDLPTGTLHLCLFRIEISSLEIIQHIFSYIPTKPLLTQIGRVCRKWYNVIQDERVSSTTMSRS